jgi:hypothetical protein
MRGALGSIVGEGGLTTRAARRLPTWRSTEFNRAPGFPFDSAREMEELLAVCRLELNLYGTHRSASPRITRNQSADLIFLQSWRCSSFCFFVQRDRTRQSYFSPVFCKRRARTVTGGLTFSQ